MQIRHDARLRVLIRSGGVTLSEAEVRAEDLDAHLTVQAYIYNANPYSGGGLWWNPASGGRLAKAPTASYELIDPGDELTNGDLCTCTACVASAEAS
jgi:hypothetical protein